MIYTTKLTPRTNHIVVYHVTTPLCIIKLGFYCDEEGDPLSINLSEARWIDAVQKILNMYGDRNNINPKELNAAPIEVYSDWEYYR